MSKDTNELLTALENCRDFTDYYNENEEEFTDSSLAEELIVILRNKKMKRAQVFRNAQISDIYGYQVFGGVRKNPERDKLLRILIAMQADLKETQGVLKRCGYPPLYVKTPSDCVIIYGIMNKLSVTQINSMLFEYKLPLI